MANDNKDHNEEVNELQALNKITKSLLLKLKNQEYGESSNDVRKRRQFVKDTISKEMK